MNTTIEDIERLAYIRNDRAVLDAIHASGWEDLKEMESELEELRAEAAGASVDEENLKEADNLREAAEAREEALDLALDDIVTALLFAEKRPTLAQLKALAGEIREFGQDPAEPGARGDLQVALGSCFNP